MFLVRYASTPGGAQTILRLAPNPTSVDYPAGPEFTEKLTPDGASVFFRPRYDVRPRRWIWADYTARVGAYEAQWARLAALDLETRLEAGFTRDSAPIEVWEDDSGEGGFNSLLPGHEGEAPDAGTGSNLKWTPVLVSNVYRTAAGGGGGPRWKESVFEFRPCDPSFSLV